MKNLDRSRYSGVTIFQTKKPVLSKLIEPTMVREFSRNSEAYQ